MSTDMERSKIHRRKIIEGLLVQAICFLLASLILGLPSLANPEYRGFLFWLSIGAGGLFVVFILCAAAYALTTRRR